MTTWTHNSKSFILCIHFNGASSSQFAAYSVNDKGCEEELKQWSQNSHHCLNVYFQETFRSHSCCRCLSRLPINHFWRDPVPPSTLYVIVERNNRWYNSNKTPNADKNTSYRQKRPVKTEVWKGVGLLHFSVLLFDYKIRESLFSKFYIAGFSALFPLWPPRAHGIHCWIFRSTSWWTIFCQYWGGSSTCSSNFWIQDDCV